MSEWVTMKLRKELYANIAQYVERNKKPYGVGSYNSIAAFVERAALTLLEKESHRMEVAA